MVIRWAQSARRHRVGRASARLAVTKAGTPAVMSDGKLLFVAADDRGRELEVVAVPLEDGDLLVIRVMPTALRRNSP